MRIFTNLALGGLMLLGSTGLWAQALQLPSSFKSHTPTAAPNRTSRIHSLKNIAPGGGQSVSARQVSRTLGIHSIPARLNRSPLAARPQGNIFPNAHRTALRHSASEQRTLPSVINPATLAGNWTFATGFGSNASGYESDHSLYSDAAGNVYMSLIFEGSIQVGTQAFTSAGDADMLVVSYSAAGTLRWAKAFGSAMLDIPASISGASDGNLFFAGSSLAGINFGNNVSYTMPSGGGLTTAFVLKMNSATGNAIWVKNLFGAEASAIVQAYDVATDVNGNPVLVGTCLGAMDATGGTAADVNFDAFVMSFSGTAGVSAARWFYRVTETLADSSAAFTEVAVNSGNRIFCAGSFTGTIDFEPTQTGFSLSSQGSSDGLLLYVEGTGDWQNARIVGTTGDDSFTDLAIDRDQDPLVVGYYGAEMTLGTVVVPNEGLRDIMVFELDTIVRLVSVANAGGTGDDQALAVTVDNNGVSHVGGLYESTATFDTFTSTSEGGWDGFIWDIDWSTGNSTALATCGGASDDLITGLRPVTGGALYASGGFTQHIGFTGTLALDTRLTGADQADAFLARIGGGCAFAPTFSVQVSGSPCLGNTVTLSATGVPAGSGYSWSGPGGFSSTATAPQVALTAGNSGLYSLILTNASNCSSAAQTATITAEAIPTVNSFDYTRCGTGTVALHTAGGLMNSTYNWYTQSTGGQPVASNTTGAYITPSLSATTPYYVSATSPAGCVTQRATVRAVISQPFTATITASGPTTICQGGAVSLTALPDNNFYSWSNGSDNPMIDVTAGGTYTVTVGQLPACTATASVTVQVLPRPNPSFAYSSTQYCQGSANPTPQVAGTAGGAFRASAAGLVLNTATGAIDLAASQPGSYQVTYRVGTTCRDSAIRDVNVLAPARAAFSYAASAFCQGPIGIGIALGNGSRAGTFTVNALGLNLNPATGEITLNSSLPNTYTVYNTVPAAGGCAAARDSFQITVNVTPRVTVSASPSATVCEGGVVVLKAQATAPSGFIWTPAGIGDSISVTTGGSYQAQATATNGGCQSTSQSIDVAFTPRPAMPTVTPTPVGGGTILTASSSQSGATFNWYFNGGLITTTHAAQLPLFDPAQSGAYSCEAVFQGCASAVTTPIIVVVTSVKAKAGADIKIHPNPTRGALFVEMPAGARATTATLISAEGRQALMSPLMEGQNRIDVSGLAKGMYMLKLVSADGVAVRQVVVE